MTDGPVRVVVVDDHELVRTGLRGVLDADPRIVVVGEAADGTELLHDLYRTRPDVVVMDLHMPGMGGIEATRRAVQESPGVAVLVLTMYDDDESVFAAVQAGALGYLLKGAGRDELRTAVHAVAHGQTVFGSGVAALVRDRMLRRSTETDAAAFPTLTRREREVLEAMAEGQEPAAIGRHLGVAEKTVRNNIASLLTKLQVMDRAAAVELARSAGFGRGHPQRRVVVCTELDGGDDISALPGHAFAVVVREHNAVVDDALVHRGGAVFGGVGGTRYAWFRQLDDAIGGVVAAQRALVAHRFPAGVAVSVRAAVHAGVVVEDGQHLVGMAIQETALLAVSAGRGDILVSGEALPDHQLPAWPLVDRGIHEIRGIDRPLRLLLASVGQGRPASQ